MLFYKQHFYKQPQAEIGKKSSKAKQHPDTELLLFEVIHFPHSCYHPQLVRDILGNVQKTSVSVLMRLCD